MLPASHPGPQLRFADTRHPLGSWGHADLWALNLCQGIWPHGVDPSGPPLFPGPLGTWNTGHVRVLGQDISWGLLVTDPLPI